MQKNIKEEYQELRKKGLAEGRYPDIYVSLTVADVVGDQAQYIRNKGLKIRCINN